MANHPIHLTILRRGDVHIVDLAEVQAIIPRSETRVDAGFLTEISEEIQRITNQVGPEYRKAAEKLDPETRQNPHVVRELKNIGSLIFSHLLPQAARDKLRGAEGCDLYLRLDDQLIHLPWELAFDGQQFLGMKFRVGRQVITHHKSTQSAPPRTDASTIKVLIISDPSETLKNVPHESEQLCNILDGVPGLEVRLIGGRGVKRIPLLAALRESDVVHFAGHSQFDEKNPEKSGWLLHDGLLSASEISKLDQTPLLVFSNSCQAGATTNWQNDYLYEGQAFGLGSAFLLAGVANYIGTFCVVHDEESRFLAVEFYKRIAQGTSFGRALLEARLTSAEKMGLDRLTWASYMLYGDPACTLSLVPKAQIEPLSRRRHAQLSNAQIATESSPILEEPKRWRFRWPRLSFKVSISLTVGMLAVLVFGHLLRNELSKEYPLNKSRPTPAESGGGRIDAYQIPETGGVDRDRLNSPVPQGQGPVRDLPGSQPGIGNGGIYAGKALGPTPDRNQPAPLVLGGKLESPPQRQPQAQQSRERLSAVTPTIQDHLRVAKFLRERSEYSRALAELEKARLLDPDNKEVKSEIENVRKTCSAEKELLKRTDLNCP